VLVGDENRAFGHLGIMLANRCVNVTQRRFGTARPASYNRLDSPGHLP
jgi:hypothetical protein